MLDVRSLEPDRVRPLLRSEYERLVELGAFDDERVELLDGALITMSPQGTRHAEAVYRLTRRLLIALADRAVVRGQSPLGAGPRSLPEPDIAVVAPGNYADRHPEGALLVIEVAESSLNKDRAKATLYAAAQIADYWIINLSENTIEVHRDPHEGRYRTLSTATSTSELAPVAFPDLVIPVGEIIP